MEKLNDWMTLAANIGELAGIVFLAYEIRVASNSVSNAAAAGYVEIWREFAENARDPEILSITGKINRDGWDSVPPDHVTRAVQWVLAGLRGAEFHTIRRGREALIRNFGAETTRACIDHSGSSPFTGRYG